MDWIHITHCESLNMANVNVFHVQKFPQLITARIKLTELKIHIHIVLID